jgi:light-regulated signal transduction histidine kinase (bacteriophytochrome)
MGTQGSSVGTKSATTSQVPSPDEQETLNLSHAIEELRRSIRDEDVRHSQELTQFAYTLSHDMREPLRMVASYTQLLNRRNDGKLDDDSREFMHYILEGVSTMERLLDDLLNYSVHLRPLEEPPVNVDSDAVARGVLMKLEKTIRGSGAEISCAGLPQVQSGFAQLSQVFHQLLLNSLRFHGAEPPRINISATENGDVVTFSFRDSGLGIEPRYHEEIFRPFKRLNGREFPGTGVGLAIAKRIVEQYGGRIWVESQLGEGSDFKFTLPKAT